MVTYAYRGYPLVYPHARHDRERRAGRHPVRRRRISLRTGWPRSSEKTGQKQAAWRTDPKRAGISNCVGDIGSHVENMVCLPDRTGDRISPAPGLDTFGEGRILDDNASILLEYKGGAKGLYWSRRSPVGSRQRAARPYLRDQGLASNGPRKTQLSARVRLYRQAHGSSLSRGRDKLSAAAQSLSRLPSGHPEGLFEAFANLYSIYLGALHKMACG